jgi:hypothetical protein
MFGSLPKRNVYSPLCDPVDVHNYQSLVASLQWAVSIKRINITTAVMTLSSFRAVPRQGHLERAKRVVSYVARFKESTIQFCTLEPDYLDIPKINYDWTRKYDGAIEDVLDDAPPPLGKFVVTATHVDANLCHDLVTGKSVSGILHWLNGTSYVQFRIHGSTPCCGTNQGTQRHTTISWRTITSNLVHVW